MQLLEVPAAPGVFLCSLCSRCWFPLGLSHNPETYRTVELETLVSVNMNMCLILPLSATLFSSLIHVSNKSIPKPPIYQKKSKKERKEEKKTKNKTFGLPFNCNCILIVFGIIIIQFHNNVLLIFYVSI